MLLEQHYTFFNSLKLTYYLSGNKAGKLLARCLKEHGAHTKIPLIPLNLIHATDKSKIFSPKDIVDAFATYYSSLYNIKNDPTTPQPTDETIQSFLADINPLH